MWRSLITTWKLLHPCPRFTTLHYFVAIKQFQTGNIKETRISLCLERQAEIKTIFWFSSGAFNLRGKIVFLSNVKARYWVDPINRQFKKFLNFPFQIMNSLSVEIATQNFKLNQNSIFTFLALSTIRWI